MKRTHTFKKAAALASASMMMLSTAGCAGNAAGSTAASTSAQAQTGDTAQEEPTKIRIFSTYTSAEESEASKFIVSEMEKACNIELIRDEVPKSAYQEKLQLAMSDGDYPDAFVFNSHTDPLLITAIEDGVIIPINDYMEGMDNLKNYIYPEAFEAAHVMNDDNLYMIPRCTVARNDGFRIRQDWLDNLGLKITGDNYTVTKDELLNILDKFTNADPDGDGQKNTYGTAFFPDNSGNFTPLFGGAFDCLGWQKVEGSDTYMDPALEIGNEKYKELLSYNQKAFQYADPNSLVATTYNYDIGMSQIFAGNISGDQTELNKTEPHAKLTYLAGVANDKGELKGDTLMPGIWGGVAITSACKHPEKVVEMLNWLLSDQGWEYALYGKPDYSYTKSADGTIAVNRDQYLEGKGTSWGTTLVRRKADTNFFLDLSLPQEDLTVVKSWLDVAVNSVVFPANLGKMPAITTDAAFVEAENARKEAITKIIMGAMDVSEYDKVLETWHKNGGDTYVEQMQEIIKSING